MAKARHSIVSILDIGSTKVVCLIARINYNGKVEIIGIGHNGAQGVKAGRITDLKAAEISIVQAVEAAEKMAGERIKKVYLNISSNNLISQRLSAELMVTGHEISDKDLNRLLLQILDRFGEQELEIIHSFAFDYMLDGNRGIDNPLGMYGNKLLGNFHVLSAPATHILNTNSCLTRCQLEVENYMSSSYASGLSCLTPDEMSLGTLFIEFGGGCTSVSIFNNGHMLYTDALPIGGTHVTNDLARGLSTDFLTAERIKTLYGSVAYNNHNTEQTIEVNSMAGQEGDSTNVNRALLVEIMRARIEEIVDIIIKKIDASGMGKYAGNKVVITGGAAQVTGLKDLVADMFGKPVRVAYPKQLSGLAESTSGIAFATPIGMVLHICDIETHYSYSKSQRPANDQGALGTIFRWLKDNFG